LAFVTMPFLVFVVPRIYWSLHPDTIIGVTGKLKLQMESKMLQTLLASLVGFTGLFVWLYTLDVRLARVRLARREREEA
jgi:heme exporter protein C